MPFCCSVDFEMYISNLYYSCYLYIRIELIHVALGTFINLLRGKVGYESSDKEKESIIYFEYKFICRKITFR